LKKCFLLYQDLANSRKMVAKLPWIFRALNITKKTASTETFDVSVLHVKKFFLLPYYLIFGNSS